jgi:D-alanine-D-alanine ligase
MTLPESNDIVLVGDIVPDGASRATIFDWDNPTRLEVDQLVRWLSTSGKRVEVVSSVQQFTSMAVQYRGRTVLPLWRGGDSRSRTAIVPAVCEALDITYVGADSFAQAACQDKSFSKYFLRAAEIDCPPDIVLHDLPLAASALETLQAFPFPVVVKPLYSACSIGVEDSSMCDTAGKALIRAEQLLDRGLGPVIIEPFVQGEEVSLCLVETNGQIDLRCVAVYRDERGSCPFVERLLTMQDKISASRAWTISCRKDEVEDGLWARVQALIRLLGPVGLFRVDGRISGGHFTAIELTPDIHLGLDSPFLGAFNAAGLPPPDVLAAVMGSAAATSVRGRLRNGLSHQTVGR